MGTRYSRQMLFKPIGEGGQELLKKAHVVVIGCGALDLPFPRRWSGRESES